MVKERSKIFRDLILSVSTGLEMRVAAGVLSADQAAPAFELLQALRDGRFRFAAETWHDAHEIQDEQSSARTYPAEMLLRACTKNGEAIRPLAPMATISQTRLQASFDKALILVAVDQALAEKLMPVSINTSARNMDSADFWNEVSDMLRNNFSRADIYNNITFEVTEDDIASSPCRDVLLYMKDEFGCKFAIDDFYHDRAYHIEQDSGFDSDDWQRLENLKGVIDFVKIDGETVEASLLRDDAFDLGALIEKIKTYVPQAQIVLERVKTADQAYALRNVADAVQGRYLTNDREQFHDELGLASTNFPPSQASLKAAMKK